MVGYAILLGVMAIGYPIAIWSLQYIKNTRFFSIAFPFFIFAAYVVCVIKIGIEAGVKDWNFTNTLPTANVSPFMYCLTPFIFLFPKKIQRYLLTLTAMLALGVLCAGLLTCIFNIVRHYAFHWQIALDSLAHIALSLYGVFLVKSKQVEFDVKTYFISGAIIIAVADVMLILNLILHTSFFGLSLYGNHSIYNVVLCKNGYLSAGLYFGGLCLVLFLGVVYQKLLNGSYLKGKQE